MKRSLTKLFSSRTITEARATSEGAKAGGRARWMWAFPPLQRTAPIPSDPKCPTPPQRILQYGEWANGAMQELARDFSMNYATVYTSVAKGKSVIRDAGAAIGTQAARGMSSGVYRFGMVTLSSLETAVLASAYSGVGESYWLMRWAPAVASGLTLGLLAHFCGIALKNLALHEGNARAHQMTVVGTLAAAAAVLTAAAAVRGQYFSRSVEAGLMSGVNPTLTTAVMVGVNIGVFCVALLLSYHHHRTDVETTSLARQAATSRLADGSTKLAELIAEYDALAQRELANWTAAMRAFCHGFEQAAGGTQGWAWMLQTNMPKILVPDFNQLARDFEIRVAETSSERAPVPSPVVEPPSLPTAPGVADPGTPTPHPRPFAGFATTNHDGASGNSTPVVPTSRRR